MSSILISLCVSCGTENIHLVGEELITCNSCHTLYDSDSRVVAVYDPRHFKKQVAQ